MYLQDELQRARAPKAVVPRRPHHQDSDGGRDEEGITTSVGILILQNDASVENVETAFPALWAALQDGFLGKSSGSESAKADSLPEDDSGKKPKFSATQNTSSQTHQSRSFCVETGGLGLVAGFAAGPTLISGTLSGAQEEVVGVSEENGKQTHKLFSKSFCGMLISS